uniref:Putative ovule protein n=1 Tax=Solanum chacoense TaxID=4108 RepID=A0A0V0HK23_SOLCH
MNIWNVAVLDSTTGMLSNANLESLFCKKYGLELRYEVLLQKSHLKRDMLSCQVKTPCCLSRKRNILETILY